MITENMDGFEVTQKVNGIWFKRGFFRKSDGWTYALVAEAIRRFV